ncbi:hypothetical protein [Helicobacter pylori]|uniref:hypothetical protein n=1 Tax=Helicobacter pylori TaxID=210 RepID=UPI002FBF01AC
MLKKVQEENTKLKEANTELNRERNDLDRDKENLTQEKTELIEKNKALTTEKEKLNTDLSNAKNQLIQVNQEKENLNNQLNASQKQVKELEQSQQVLKNEKAELLKEKDNLTQEKTELTEKNKVLTTEKDNLNTDLSNAKSQVIQVNQEKENLEQKYAPYKKLEKLYEVFLEVRGCLNFNFVATTHSAMDLIAYVLSDSKYYVESLYNKASQELSNKRSDKGEKLAELFDLLFEYIKDKKFERLKEPSAYDFTCKSLYPEQNTSQKMQRVVLIGYTYDKKTPPYYTIVDMGS